MKRILVFAAAAFSVASGSNPTRIIGIIVGWRNFIKNIRETKDMISCILKSKDFVKFVEAFKLKGMGMKEFYGRINQGAGKKVKGVMESFKKIREALLKRNFKAAGKEGAAAVKVLLADKKKNEKEDPKDEKFVLDDKL